MENGRNKRERTALKTGTEIEETSNRCQDGVASEVTFKFFLKVLDASAREDNPRVIVRTPRTDTQTPGHKLCYKQIIIHAYTDT